MRRNESLVSITDYSKEEILEVLETAKLFEKNPNRHVLDGKVIATLFFEPSKTEFRNRRKPFGRPRYRFFRRIDDQFHQRRDTERHHHYGK